MRNEMLRSLISPMRTAPKPLSKTQLAIDMILPILLKDPLNRVALHQSAADALSDRFLDKLDDSFRQTLQHISRI